MIASTGRSLMNFQTTVSWSIRDIPRLLDDGETPETRESDKTEESEEERPGARLRRQGCNITSGRYWMARCHHL